MTAKLKVKLYLSVVNNYDVASGIGGEQNGNEHNEDNEVTPPQLPHKGINDRCNSGFWGFYLETYFNSLDESVNISDTGRSNFCYVCVMV